jgi:hypothetical protein
MNVDLYQEDGTSRSSWEPISHKTNTTTPIKCEMSDHNNARKKMLVH